MNPDPFAIAASKSHHPVLRAGVSVGASLCGLAFTWFFIANRLAFLDRFAVIRNLAAATLAAILLLVPACRFLKSPARLFLSGLIAWAMLTLAYSTMAARFPALDERMGIFHLFILGAVAYGLLATVVWVANLMLHLRHQPLPVVRRRMP